MPKSMSATSIRTLWENNPDTPLSASNMSRLQDMTASYLNTDGYPDLAGFENLHVEGTILFRHPENSSQLIVKRGTIIQIINEATDNDGHPVVPKNSQYRIFDVGLEDIILTFKDTDNTQQDESTWGNGTNSWFVYICDKDDNVVYSKDMPDEYGGGAEILISKRSDYPLGQVPGRTQHNYSEKDTRLIGGFKTSGDIIVEGSVWDIAGKFNKVKAKAYYILDEYASGGQEYRQIRLSDLNTNATNTFNNSVVVSGSITSGDIIAQNTTLVGSLLQTGSSVFSGDVEITGVTTFDGEINTSANITMGNDLYVNGIFEVENDMSSVFRIEPQVPSVVVNADYAVTGDFNLDGVYTQSGDFTQSGNVTLGGSGRSISAEGTLTVSGNTNIVGSFSVPNTSGDPLFEVDQDTGEVSVNSYAVSIVTEQLNISAPVDIQETLNVNSGTGGITLKTTGNIISNVGGHWQHLGDFIFDGPESSVIIRSASDNEIFSVNKSTEQVSIDGVVDVTIPQGETFTVKNHLGGTILGIEYDDTLPSEKRVAINTVLDLSTGSADNALNVTGNAFISGDLEVGTLIAGNITGEVTGGASSWTNPLTLDFVGSDVNGNVDFSGNEGVVNVTLQVRDNSHSHDNYLEQSDFNLGGTATVDWSRIDNKLSEYNPAEHNNDHHSEDYLVTDDINWDVLTGNTLVGIGPEQILTSTNITFNFLNTNRSLVGSGATQVAQGSHTHTAGVISYNNATSTLDAANVQDAIDEIATNVSGIDLDVADIGLTQTYGLSVNTSTGSLDNVLQQMIIGDATKSLNQLDARIDTLSDSLSDYVQENTNVTFSSITSNSSITSTTNMFSRIFAAPPVAAADLISGESNISGFLFSNQIDFSMLLHMEPDVTDVFALKVYDMDAPTPYSKRVVVSDDETNVAPAAKKWDSSITLSISGSGLDGSTLVSFDGSVASIPVALNLDEVYVNNMAAFAVDVVSGGEGLNEVYRRFSDNSQVFPPPTGPDDVSDKIYKRLSVDFAGTGASNKVARSDHNHLNDHYTKTEVTTALGGKSDVGHNHDGDYQERADGFVYGRVFFNTSPSSWLPGDVHVDNISSPPIVKMLVASGGLGGDIWIELGHTLTTAP